MHAAVVSRPVFVSRMTLRVTLFGARDGLRALRTDTAPDETEC
jgi:hypothetical protein